MDRRPEPSRITAALDARAMYGPGVDEACGVREPAVDQWESGELVPTTGQVAKLAVLTGFSVEYFYGPPLQPVTAWVCRRSGPGRGCELVTSTPRRAPAYAQETPL